MLISLDTETTGVDLAHGAMPFLVTTCCDQGVIRFWEWDVDPRTRRPDIPPDDLADIAELLDAAELVYLQNSKFDARALATVDLALPWHKVRDTLVAGHLLASNHRHDLTWACIEYLGVDIEPHELFIKEVTQRCRKIAKQQFPDWKLADEGVPGMPSVKKSTKRDEDKPWKNDMWLPAALANHMVTNGYCHKAEVDESWLTACQRYANADSEHTLPLGLEMERRIQERGLWRIYEHRLRLMQVDADMESYGMTLRGDYTNATAREYEEYVAESEAALVEIAAGYGHALELASGAALNDNMRDFFYGAVYESCGRCSYFKRIKHWQNEEPSGDVCPKCAKSTKRRAGVSMPLVVTRRGYLGLPVMVNGDGGATLNADVMRQYLATTDGAAYEFVELLASKRMYDTALTYIEGYRRYWVPVPGRPGYYRIHASINPCGTDHLRQSSNSPNLQNVSGDTKEISNRACFGPTPDREWWRFDLKSIERRIPAYESGEPKMMAVFDKPDEGPYWGSLYYLTASVLYPDEFMPLAEFPIDDPRGFKKQHPKLYKQAKFFDLAKQYGCGPRKGDLLSRRAGSFDLMNGEFPRLAALQAKYLDDARRLGYVETLPDRSVDPTRGYPILAARTEDGWVLSTTPFNYHTSGTACWVKNVAMVNAADRCAEWRAEGFDAHLIMEVHDELVFDFPRGRDMEENLPRALEIKTIMERAGMNLVPPIPTPATCEYIVDSWADGVPV